MQISNVKFEEENVDVASRYVLTFGYEERSFFLFDKVKDKLDSSKKNTKKKWNNVHLQNYVAIPTILDQFSGHFSGHFLV